MANKIKFKKKPYNPWLAHRNHQTDVRPSGNEVHWAKYWCVKCDKFIGWMSKVDYETWKGKS